tara:strand:+ start:5982 stop:6239 length:258 start_codon:yes stop_codon:yes gene_type:complete
MSIQQTKVTEEELKEIEQFQENINHLTYQLGQLELQKLNLNQNKLILENQHINLIQLEKELGNKLKEKYGNSQIDLKTGEIIQDK